VVGLNESDNQAFVPNVVGMKCLTATDAVHGNSLNVRTVYDSSVKDYNDSIVAVVYRQNPEPQTSELKGTQVTMYLTVNEEKILKAANDGAVQ
jgi:beta-lactam-binding protein with PASTA domain